MANGSGKLNVPHAFTADFGACDLNATAIANGAFVTDAFIFTAMTFPIANGTENAFAKETVAFGLKGAVVDSFGLFNFAVRPLANHLRTSQTDAHTVEKVNVSGVNVIVVVDRNLILSAVKDADIQSDGLQFANKDFEGFGDARGRDILPFDDRFVSLNAPNDVIGLNGENFL